MCKLAFFKVFFFQQMNSYYGYYPIRLTVRVMVKTEKHQMSNEGNLFVVIRALSQNINFVPVFKIFQELISFNLSDNIMRRAKKAVDASWEAFSICKKCSKLPETAIFGSFLDESVFFEYGSSERKFFFICYSPN